MCDTQVLPSTHGVGELRRGTRGTGGLGRGQLRRRRLDRGAAPAARHASRPSSPRRRPPSRRGRSGRPRGPRRPRRGSPRAVGSRAAPPGAGCASGGRCATCPSAPRPGARAPSGSTQAQAIASARRHRTESSMARDEAMLVAQAAEMGFEDFYRALSYWKQLADPDGADAADEERKAARNVFFEAELQRDVAGPDDPRPGLGLHRLGRAQPPRARPLRGRLRRGQRAPGAHGPDRRAGPHLGPAPGRRPRRDGHAQRAPPRPTASAPPRSSSVFVGYETLHGRICELENGTVLAPSALSPWMDSAYFERAIFSLGNRVDVSVRARLFSGGTRRAIELRDRICTHPYCYEPAESCQVDHIEPYAEGGPTTQENGRLLCGFHNRLRNQRERPGTSASGPRRARPEGAAASGPARPRRHPGCRRRQHRNPKSSGASSRPGRRGGSAQVLVFVGAGERDVSGRRRAILTRRGQSPGREPVGRPQRSHGHRGRGSGRATDSGWAQPSWG